MMGQIVSWGGRIVAAMIAAIFIATRATGKATCTAAFLLLAVGLAVALFVPSALIRGFGGAVACAAAGSLGVLANMYGRDSDGKPDFFRGMKIAWRVAFSSEAESSASGSGSV